MGAGLGLGLESSTQQGGYLVITDGPGRSWSGLLIEPDQTLPQETSAPLTHGGAGQTQLAGNGAVIEAVSGQQDNLGPLGQGLGKRPRTGHAGQLLSHLGIYNHWWNGASNRHGFSFRLKKPTINNLFFKVIYETRH
jgi:hypothetical protein